MKYTYIFTIVVIFALAAPALGNIVPGLDIAGSISAEAGAGGAAKKKGGPLAQLVELVVVIAQGVVDGLAPLVAGVYSGVVPLLRAILDLLEIHVCKPNTKTELLVWDIGEFYNTRLVGDLHVPEIKGLCKDAEIEYPDAAKRIKITGITLPGAGDIAAVTGWADVAGGFEAAAEGATALAGEAGAAGEAIPEVTGEATVDASVDASGVVTPPEASSVGEVAV